MKVILILISIFCYALAVDISTYAGVGTTLKLVHVIFRHGDRTPDSLYPNDPYTEKDFWPFRIGHLTNKGKMTSYNIGVYIRQKYGKLLGDVYTPDLLTAVSSSYPRCKATLEAVLASMWPPTEVLKWNPDLLWEPIPYDAIPSSNNKLFLAYDICPRAPDLKAMALKAAESDPMVAKYGYLLPFLRQVTGMTDSFFEIGINLYSTLKSESEAGLPLPNWSKDIYPEILYELGANAWKYYTGIGDLKILQAGYLMSQMINTTDATINGEEVAKNKKIYLYSGHDITMASILYYLDNFKVHNPPYGSYVIVEVHKFLEMYFLKFLYQNYEHEEPQPLFIPNCGIYCPLDLFKKIYAKALDTATLDAICG